VSCTVDTRFSRAANGIPSAKSDVPLA